ncbi:hypothetical protein [Thalassospira marina]|uniref:Morphogenetic protein n=1 Tax=Thalassospira marina TaxID=2048283 RepID=A0A2N3KY51_9PROT|nr:hypothetical protein [Thalassospira marina]PKR55443.1 hypothetical protein COO20_04540 [Thalassospira marina]
MQVKPILFSAPMVRAILDGRKTQTRRVIKPQPYSDNHNNCIWNGCNYGQGSNGNPHFDHLASPLPSSKTKKVNCPYGKPGDLLWVRESWQALSFGDYLPTKDHVSDVRYMATDKLAGLDKDARGWPWRPSIHMPRWASRITLEITDIRVQRLNQIAAEDARAEGVDQRSKKVREFDLLGASNDVADRIYLNACRWEFRDLWERINGPDSWDANPWVWAVSFNPHMTNVDAFLKGSAA